ncbi:MAG: hypothetical protein ABS948_16855 [Solibacillus sp.]
MKLVKQMMVPVVAAALLVGCNDTSVATINGESITEHELHEKLVQQYGVETLDQLVSNKVIELEAEKQGVTASKEAIDAEYEAYIDMYGSEEELAEYLATYKMTPEDVRYDIEIYLLTTALMEKYVEITEADVEQYFEDNKANFKEGAALSDVRDAVYDALLEERVNEQYGTWIDEKYKEYDIMTTFFEQSE